MATLNYRRAHDNPNGCFAFALRTDDVAAVLPGPWTPVHVHSSATGETAVVLMVDGSFAKLAISAADLVTALSAASWSGTSEVLEVDSIGSAIRAQHLDSSVISAGTVPGTVTDSVFRTTTDPAVGGAVRERLRIAGWSLVAVTA